MSYRLGAREGAPGRGHAAVPEDVLKQVDAGVAIEGMARVSVPKP